MTIVFGLGLAVAAGVGLYLRWIDAERRRDLDRVRQDERLAIARELHDVVAHYVTGIVVQAQAAQEVWTDQPDKASRRSARSRPPAPKALGSMRRLVGTLRGGEDAPLAPAATIDDLRSLAARSTRRRPAGPAAPRRRSTSCRTEMAPSIHRVVGEAITNAQRHAAGATGVDVRISARGGELTVVVDDDGSRRRGRRAARPPVTGSPAWPSGPRRSDGRFDAGPEMVAVGGSRPASRCGNAP